MKTYVIDLLGGPGLGKSTTASKVFAELKDKGELVELVREAIKDWIWTGRKTGPFGQSIVYGQQLERESILYNKVEFIVTDSPLILCPVYQKHYNGHESIKHAVFKDIKNATKLDIVHVNFLLTRKKLYDPRGRNEDEKTAVLLDKKIEAFLTYHGIDYNLVDCSEKDRVKFIVNKVLSIRDASKGDKND